MKTESRPKKIDFRNLPIGLVCEGGITNSYIGKLKGIVERLGPVRANVLRVASRIANSLRSGTPTENYDELDSCGMIVVVAVPETMQILLDELLAANIDWSGKTLLLLDSGLDCEDLSSFLQRHAQVATLDLIEGYQDLRFIVQSDSRTVKRLKSLLDGSHVRLLEIEWGTKPLYYAGLTIATSLANPLMAASVESLMGCGMELSQAQNIVDQTLHRTQRAFMKAGKRGWSGHLASKNTEAIRKQWSKLHHQNPVLANYFVEIATLSLEYFRQDSRFIADLASIPRRQSGRVLKVSSSSTRNH